MKTFVLSLLILLVSEVAFAQPTISAKSEKFEWELARNPKATTSKYSYPMKVLLRDKTGTYVLFSNGRKTEYNNPELHYFDMKQPSNKAYDGTENYLVNPEDDFIMKIDNNGKVSTMTVPSPPKLKPKTNFIRMNVMSFNGKLYLIGNFMHQEKVMSSDVDMTIVMIEIDKETFQCKTDKLIELGSFDYWKYLDFRCVNQMPYGFKVSENGKRLGLVVFDPLRKNEESKVSYKVFDENFKVIKEFSRSEKLDEYKGVYRMYQYSVGNDGTIVEYGNLALEFEYMSEFDWYKLYKNEFEGCSSIIRAYPFDGAKGPVTHKSERFVGDGQIKTLPSGKFGIHRISEDNYYSIAIYNPNNNQIDEVFTELSNDEMYVNKKALKKSNDGSMEVYLRGVDILEDDKSNIFVVYEQAQGVYSRHNIIAAEFDSELNLQWQQSIPRAVIVDDRFICAHNQIVSLIKDNQLVIMYNDNSENAKISPLTGDNIEWVQGKSNGVCMVTSFNGGEGYTRKPLLEVGDGLSLESWLISTIWYRDKDDNVIFLNDYDGIRMLNLD